MVVGEGWFVSCPVLGFLNPRVTKTERQESLFTDSVNHDDIFHILSCIIVNKTSIQWVRSLQCATQPFPSLLSPPDIVGTRP